MSSQDKPIVIQAQGAADASVIWLHGLGADGHDFEPVVAEFSNEIRQRVRFIFPNAPQQPVTINGGMVMRAWYDITETDLARRPDEQGVRASEMILSGLIESEIDAGISSDRIVVAGFSQGGAIALHTGLRYGKKLGGILALSTYLPLHEATEKESSGANREIPIFMAHGSQDPVIPLSSSESSRAFLTSLGYVIETHTYPMPHSVCGEELRDIEDWLSRTLLWQRTAH
ncbi:MAG TPA: carboxylesterase [Gammaproteobacteria bacterium]